MGSRALIQKFQYVAALIVKVGQNILENSNHCHVQKRLSAAHSLCIPCKISDLRVSFVLCYKPRECETS